jgi:hypothetical protein
MSAALEEALGAADAALAAGDPDRAAEAVERAAAAAAVLQARGARLPPDALARARALQTRVLHAALRERDRLAAELAAAAASRRAAAAYGR